MYDLSGGIRHIRFRAKEMAGLYRSSIYTGGSGRFGIWPVSGFGRTTFCSPEHVWVWGTFSACGDTGYEYKKSISCQSRQFGAELVLEDLSELEIMEDGAGKRIQVSGSIGSSPIIRNMPQHYQILNRLVPGTFYGGGTWGEKYFFGYFGLEDWEGVEQIRIWNEGEPDLRTWDLPVLKDTMYHTIRGDEGYILIELKG